MLLRVCFVLTIVKKNQEAWAVHFQNPHTQLRRAGHPTSVAQHKRLARCVLAIVGGVEGDVDDGLEIDGGALA
jgi:hypothetical protein